MLQDYPISQRKRLALATLFSTISSLNYTLFGYLYFAVTPFLMNSREYAIIPSQEQIEFKRYAAMLWQIFVTKIAI